MNPGDVIGIVMSILSVGIVLTILGLSVAVYWVDNHG